MDYPFWDTEIGYGLLMAFVAIIHVFVSHFAIGGGLYLVLAERRAHQQGNEQWLEYLQRLTKFFVLVTVVIGALSGVGIWFVIGLLNPAATELLIRNFVWAWAIEWTLFITEICSILLYFYGWKRMSARSHMILGWIYFVSAWMSLFVINGIISFMLTPGDWISTGDFWDGFFNPTFWPALLFRTSVCIVLAGLYAMVVAARIKEADFKRSVVRYNAVWGIVGLVVSIPALWWYHNSAGSSILEAAGTMMSLPAFSLWLSYLLAGVTGALLILFGLIAPRLQHSVIAIIGMVCALGWFGAFEWYRESIRKPFVISQYMYANGVDLANSEVYRKEGYLSHMTFRTSDPGADLFRRACRSCHTIDGYRPLKAAYDGTDAEFIAGTIRGAHVMKGNMPPFLGTEKEIEMLAAHLYERFDHRSLSEIYSLEGAALGKKVYEVRCGSCHQMGGYNDISETITDMTDDDYNDLLDESGDMADEMPAFTGDEVEREALIEYWKSLGDRGGK